MTLLHSVRSFPEIQTQTGSPPAPCADDPLPPRAACTHRAQLGALTHNPALRGCGDDDERFKCGHRGDLATTRSARGVSSGGSLACTLAAKPPSPDGGAALCDSGGGRCSWCCGWALRLDGPQRKQKSRSPRTGQPLLRLVVGFGWPENDSVVNETDQPVHVPREIRASVRSVRREFPQGLAKPLHNKQGHCQVIGCFSDLKSTSGGALHSAGGSGPPKRPNSIHPVVRHINGLPVTHLVSCRRSVLTRSARHRAAAGDPGASAAYLLAGVA